MTTESSTHYYLNWAKARIDEMDAALATFDGKIGEPQANAREKGQRILADLRKKRDDFRNAVTKQPEANEVDWIEAKAQFDADWNAFEAGVEQYFDNRGEQIQATFKRQAEAQIKAWRHATGELRKAAEQFAANRRSDIDAAVKRMSADAAAAEDKLQKLSQAGSELWSVFTRAPAESRATFDRANQAVRDAFERAST